LQTAACACAYQAAGNANLALPLFEKTLKLMKMNLGPDHPDTLNCMNNFAMAGYEGMKQREEKIPAPGRFCLTDALERLVQLDEALGK
jgi:hypothetical protein